jgi:hypothetical protein
MTAEPCFRQAGLVDVADLLPDQGAKREPLGLRPAGSVLIGLGLRGGSTSPFFDDLPEAFPIELETRQMGRVLGLLAVLQALFLVRALFPCHRHSSMSSFPDAETPGPGRVHDRASIRGAGDPGGVMGDADMILKRPGPRKFHH